MRRLAGRGRQKPKPDAGIDGKHLDSDRVTYVNRLFRVGDEHSAFQIN